MTDAHSQTDNLTKFIIQSRFVRLVCAVLQSLIRKNPSSVRGLFAEIQTFCLAFSKAKEAISLYALIKSVDSAT